MIVRTNSDRARRAARALKAYRSCVGDADTTPEEDVTDLLCDLRHYCDAEDLDLAALDRIGHSLYRHECAEERAARNSAP